MHILELVIILEMILGISLSEDWFFYALLYTHHHTSVKDGEREIWVPFIKLDRQLPSHVLSLSLSPRKKHSSMKPLPIIERGFRYFEVIIFASYH